MGILGDIADVIRATTELVREARPKSAPAPLHRSHCLDNSPGVPCASKALVSAPHCMYCGKLAPLPIERCPFFT